MVLRWIFGEKKRTPKPVDKAALAGIIESSKQSFDEENKNDYKRINLQQAITGLFEKHLPLDIITYQRADFIQALSQPCTWPLNKHPMGFVNETFKEELFQVITNVHNIEIKMNALLQCLVPKTLLGCIFNKALGVRSTALSRGSLKLIANFLNELLIKEEERPLSEQTKKILRETYQENKDFQHDLKTFPNLNFLMTLLTKENTPNQYLTY